MFHYIHWMAKLADGLEFYFWGKPRQKKVIQVDKQDSSSEEENVLFVLHLQ